MAKKLPKEAKQLHADKISEIPGLLWDLRTSQNMTQAQVAKKMGKVQNYISQIENPEIQKIPKLETLLPYLKAINHKVVIVPANVQVYFLEQ